jgi:glycosyltransferase involved in cell wall biosynthesis
VVQSVTGLGSLFARGHWRAAALRAVVRPLYRLALGGASTIFQSSADRDEFVRGRLVDPARVHVIRGSGVDVARFRPAQPAATGAPRVIFVARLLREKGVETLVEAARRVRATHPQVRFSVVGEPDPGNPSSITGAELERWRSEGAVEFLGHRDDVDALMREASIFALPTYYREGVPRSLIEAAASGLALIATDQPGCLEVVQPEVTGAVIAARDPEALAAAIRRLADHPELRAAWGRAARAAACERFSEERVLEETAAVYAVALGRMKP